jgi:hypothetical protein
MLDKKKLQTLIDNDQFAYARKDVFMGEVVGAWIYVKDPTSPTGVYGAGWMRPLSSVQDVLSSNNLPSPLPPRW